MAGVHNPNSYKLPKTVLWKGYLDKRQRGRSLNAHLGRLKFQRRYCILNQDKLQYFLAKNKDSSPKGEFMVKDIMIVEKVPDVTFLKQYCFQIGNGREMMYFAAKSESEREVWMETLRTAASLNKNEMLERYHTGAFGQCDSQKWSCCDWDKSSPGCRKSTSSTRGKLRSSVPYLINLQYDHEVDNNSLDQLDPYICQSLPDFSSQFDEDFPLSEYEGSEVVWKYDSVSDSESHSQQQSLSQWPETSLKSPKLSTRPPTPGSKLTVETYCNGHRSPSPLVNRSRSASPYRSDTRSPSPRSRRRSPSPNLLSPPDHDSQHITPCGPRYHSVRSRPAPRADGYHRRSRSLRVCNTSSEVQYIGEDLLIYKKQKLGSGAFGCVFKGELKENTCAVKVLHALGMEIASSLPGTVQTESLERFKRECEFLESLTHKNIVCHLTTLIHPESNLPVLVLELLDCNLKQYLSDYREDSLPISTQLSLCCDITSAIEFLHKKNIIHRDLCADNILMKLGENDDVPVAKVTDFGMSRIIDCNTLSNTLTGMGHRAGYLPPEASLISSSSYDSSLDVFMLGVIMIQIVTKTSHVKSAEERCELVSRIEETHPLKNIILQCLQEERERRPVVTQICVCLSVLLGN